MISLAVSETYGKEMSCDEEVATANSFWELTVGSSSNGKVHSHKRRDRNGYSANCQLFFLVLWTVGVFA
jgi:hypothetical protein